MSIVGTFIQQYEFNRSRTLSLLDKIAERPDATACLIWRPGPGRAHIGWQLMHIGITEELFASERLASKEGRFREHWERFKGGSTPDDQPVQVADIRAVLAAGREDLLGTLSELQEDRLGEIIWEARDGRRLTLLQVLQIISWHEPHHQGQAHITLNLYNAASHLCH